MKKTMKTASKLFAMILAVVMIMAMSVPAIAESGTSALTSGTITISNAEDGNTYSIYKLFELESFDTENDAYSYIITSESDWYDFVATGSGAAYVELAEHSTSGGVTTYYVTWNSEMQSNADMATFAKLALAYAEANSISATATKTANTTDGTDNEDGTFTLVFSDLGLGYYLVGTTLGTLCSLDSTTPSVSIEEKNQEPTIDKKIVVDEETTSSSSTASIGDTVNYQITIVAQEGAESYVVHDTMSTGLTFKSSSVKVTLNDEEVASSNYTVSTTTEDSCTFELSFDQDWLDTLEDNDEIVITYSAAINADAVTGTSANSNDAYLNYGDSTSINSTEKTTTITYTYTFDIVKTNSSYELLDGAEFVLYDAEEDGNIIPLVKVEDGVYRVADEEERAASGFESATIVATDGQATVIGLGNGTYWLEETKAPEGYNKLADRVEVKIEDENLSTTMTGTTWTEGDGGVRIVNTSGSLLPSTGGVGTTLFYIVGAALVLGAAVILTVHVARSNSRKKAEE